MKVVRTKEPCCDGIMFVPLYHVTAFILRKHFNDYILTPEGQYECDGDFFESVEDWNISEEAARERAQKREIMEKDIEELNLSVRSYNCLKRAGINTISELAACDEEFLESWNLGTRSLRETQLALQKYIGDDEK